MVIQQVTSSSYRTAATTLGMIGSGKYYWEIKRNEDDGNDLHAGVMSEDNLQLMLLLG